MNKTIQRTISFWILTLMTLMLVGCVDTLAYPPELTPVPGNSDAINPAYAFAQATIDAGERQLLDLSLQATEIKLNMDRAEDAAVLSTQEYGKQQQMQMDFQATLVSQNIAKAAATQEFFAQKTSIAVEATAAAQSHAATVTQLAIQVHGTQTVQVQAYIDNRIQQTVQAAAAMTAYPMTATPLAETQAALLMQQYAREQQTFLDQVVVPLLPFAAGVALLVFIVLVVLAVRRTTRPVPWFLRLRGGIDKGYSKPSRIMDGVAVNLIRPENEPYRSERAQLSPPHLPGENPARVEIANATEIPVAHWINEVEGRMVAEGRLKR